MSVYIEFAPIKTTLGDEERLTIEANSHAQPSHLKLSLISSRNLRSTDKCSSCNFSGSTSIAFGFSYNKNILHTFLSVFHILFTRLSDRRTDGQTDRQTDGHFAHG